LLGAMLMSVCPASIHSNRLRSQEWYPRSSPHHIAKGHYLIFGTAKDSD